MLSKTMSLAAGVLALTAATLITGCGGPSDAANSSAVMPSTQAELVAAAKTEGTVSLGTGGHTTAQAELLVAAFEKKYGIEVTFVRESSGSIAQKVQAQATGGNMAFDVVSLIDTATLQVWQDEGLLADSGIEGTDKFLDQLVLDPEAAWVPSSWAPLGYVYNDSAVKATEAPKTWEQLARQDGVRAVSNPATSGSSLMFFTAMEALDTRLLSQLRGQEVLVTESGLALTQMVATGEADFAFPASEPDIMAARKSGEPLMMGYPEGPVPAAPSYIAALKGAKHPAAARLLTQFQVSDEFQQMLGGIGTRSVLENAPVPSGLPTIDPKRLVVVGPDELVAAREKTIASFTENLAR